MYHWVSGFAPWAWSLLVSQYSPGMVSDMGKIRETGNCVRCGKPANFWSGHVDYFQYIGNKIRRVSVIAGWCSNHCFNDRGFKGMYFAWMGGNGEQPSPCCITTSPKRNSVIHIIRRFVGW